MNCIRLILLTRFIGLYIDMLIVSHFKHWQGPFNRFGISCSCKPNYIKIYIEQNIERDHLHILLLFDFAASDPWTKVFPRITSKSSRVAGWQSSSNTFNTVNCSLKIFTSTLNIENLTPNKHQRRPYRPSFIYHHQQNKTTFRQFVIVSTHFFGEQ